ncbi:hypothetical protein CKAH01_15574 [Colletotrichum kahawae]|uniref:Uncharacterized protein n=1 Tax=Colletotrichum kahawae TaxID=34407 RepID=A0AAE0D8D2_COLKA|nr:hypothetical protein CKAH01_15574 [Colletotrichum kahawae]
MCSIRSICDKTCQERATIDGLDAEHFKLCVDQPRTIADILFKSIINHQVPTDQKTLSDYRFDICFDDYDKKQLVTAYRSVLVYNYVMSGG